MNVGPGWDSGSAKNNDTNGYFSIKRIQYCKGFSDAENRFCNDPVSPIDL
jgi:hypothetical protein